MTKPELFDLIQESDLIPVPVLIEEDEDSGTIHFFDGDLTQFLNTAKLIGSKAIFVQDNAFEEDNFVYNPAELDEYDHEDDEGEDPEIDLAAMSPALAKFKKYLGENYSFCLVAKGGADDLRLIVDQDWVKDFEDEWERTMGKFLLQLEAEDN